MIASIPRQALGDVGRISVLPTTARLLWMILLTYEGRLTTQADLAQHLGMSVRVICLAVRNLTNHKLIQVRRSKTGSFYTCLMPQPANGGNR